MSKQNETKLSQSQKGKQKGFVNKYLLCCFSLKKISASRSEENDSVQLERQIERRPYIFPKATKVFRNNQQESTSAKVIQFKTAVVPPRFAQSAKMIMKEQFPFASQNEQATHAALSPATDSLDFRLDSEPGVSTTFQVPYFDYGGLIQFSDRYYGSIPSYQEYQSQRGSTKSKPGPKAAKMPSVSYAKDNRIQQKLDNQSEVTTEKTDIDQ